MNKASIKQLLKKGKPSAIQKNIEPMLATLVTDPVEEPGWLYEIKWDGYRAIAYMNKGVVDIRSRNNKSFNEKFYPVYEALKNWKINAVVDGEIVVVNEQGLPDFGDLQLWRSEADGQLAFYVFGRNLCKKIKQHLYTGCSFKRMAENKNRKKAGVCDWWLYKKRKYK